MKFPTDKKQQCSFFLRLLGTLIALGVVAYLGWQNWAGFVDALQTLPLSLLGLVLLLAFASRIMVTVRWFILLRVVEPDVTFWQVIKLSFVGLFTTNVLPSTIGGDVVKLGGAVQARLDSAGVTASLVVDRLVGMATMATFLPFGLLRLFQGNTAGASAGLSSVFFGNLWKKLTVFFGRIWRSLRLWANQPASLFWAAVFSFLHMACTFTMVTLILRGLADPISWWRAGGLWVLVYFITMIPISINGLGLQEASLSLIYTNFAGVSESNSLVLALMMRVLFMIASLPGAFFLPGFLSGKEKANGLNQDGQPPHE